jgi:hypothetical protein
MIKALSIYKKADHKRSKETIPLDIFLENIRNGFWQDLVLPIRAIEDKKLRTVEKEKVPMVTISGTFLERKDDALIQHSGYIAIDIDECDNLEETKSLICPDKYVVAAFSSISGRGLCLIFKINPEKHREAFAGICEYMYNNYKIICDPTSVNVSRTRFVSFDPHIYIAERAEKFTYYPKPKLPKKIDKVLYVNDDFNFILDQINSGQVNITQDSYHVWLRIGFALVHKFQESGRQYFHVVSQYSSKYNYESCDRQYNACLKHHNPSSIVTISTFYYYCKEAGLQIYSERTKKIAYSASQGNKAGLNALQIAENLSRFEEITGQDVVDLINKVIANNIQLNEDTLLDQLEMWIRQNYSLKRNEVTRYIENNGKPLQKKDLNTIYIRAKKIFEKVPFDLVDRLIDSDFVPMYNPFIDFFNEHGGQEILNDLDRTKQPPVLLKGEINGDFVKEFPNITKFFASLHASNGDYQKIDRYNHLNPYVLYFGVKWMVGAISAAYGIHSPLVFVLCGGQNTGKTQFFRRMMPAELKRYYAESKLDAGKDDDILMCQKWFIMDDEMSGKSKKDTLKINTLTSKEIFSLREPYGHGNVDLIRLAVLCGTSNYTELLADPTGNRRMIPIHLIDKVDFALYNSVNKADLWMEAYKLYHMGFDWEVKTEDIEYLGVDKSLFEISSSEMELIVKYFEPGMHELTATDIKVFIEQHTKQHLSLDQLSKQLKKLGFEQRHVKVSKTTKRVYLVNYLIGDQPPSSPRSGFATWDKRSESGPDQTLEQWQPIEPPKHKPDDLPF